MFSQHVASARHTCKGRKEVRDGQCLTLMSTLRHFQTEDWGAGQILTVFLSHFFSVFSCLSVLYCPCCSWEGWGSLQLNAPQKDLGKHTYPASASPWGIPPTFQLSAWSYSWGQLSVRSNIRNKSQESRSLHFYNTGFFRSLKRQLLWGPGGVS